MLFLLKRAPHTALCACLILCGIGALGRWLSSSPLPLQLSLHSILLGTLVFGVVLLSDGIIHSILWLGVGKWYRDRHRELCATFKDQTVLAIFSGALMAGLGEELVFRGISLDLRFLIPGAVLFGLLHHLSSRLWPITIWSIWEGLLFAAAAYLTGSLLVTMVAHFLHDFFGFLAIRWLNRSQ